MNKELLTEYMHSLPPGSRRPKRKITRTLKESRYKVDLIVTSLLLGLSTFTYLIISIVFILLETYILYKMYIKRE